MFYFSLLWTKAFFFLFFLFFSFFFFFVDRFYWYRRNVWSLHSQAKSREYFFLSIRFFFCAYLGVIVSVVFGVVKLSTLCKPIQTTWLDQGREVRKKQTRVCTDDRTPVFCTSLSAPVRTPPTALMTECLPLPGLVAILCCFRFWLVGYFLPRSFWCSNCYATQCVCMCTFRNSGTFGFKSFVLQPVTQTSYSNREKQLWTGARARARACVCVCVLWWLLLLWSYSRRKIVFGKLSCRSSADTEIMVPPSAVNLELSKVRSFKPEVG